jgi:hypothetical protein
MANKGLKSLAESSANFSNQALENAINELKIGWVSKSFTVDTSITDNTVLTTTQKNDLKALIDNVPHINVGKVLGDLIRHTNTILDGSILPVDETVDNPTAGTFLEILQEVQALQNLIPTLFGVTPAEKNRSVNDHLGTLNNIFLETDDSSEPVFTTYKNAIIFINNASLATETALETAYDNLIAFLNSVVSDSTDFQQTLNTFGTAIATAHTNLNNALASEPYLTKRTQLVNSRESVNVQVTLENSNISNIRSFTETLSNNIAFTSLAEDESLRKLMANVAQNQNWKNYFNEYKTNQSNLNPIYNTTTDSDKSAVIDAVLRSQGLPDVTDSLDLEAVANKAKQDSRIDTAGFDLLFTEMIITKSCEQLGLSTRGSVYNQSELLLSNLNQRDRDLVAQQLDLNESAGTLS